MSAPLQQYGMLANPAILDYLREQQDQQPVPQKAMVSATPAPDASGNIVHVLKTADNIGGPVAPSPAPVSPLPALAPKVALDPDPVEQQKGHLANTLQADYRKDADPYGSPDNHPGFFGKLAHALSHATGGDTRRQWEEQGIAKQLNEVTAEHSQNRSRNAATAKTEQETATAPAESASRQALQESTAKHLDVETQQMQDGGASLATGYAHAVNQAIKEGRDPSTDPIVQHLADAITSIQKQPVAKDVSAKEQVQRQLLAAEQKGDPATVKKLQQQLKDMDPMGENHLVIQQQTAANNQGKASDAKTEKEYTYTRNKWDKDLGAYQAQNEKLNEASGFIGKGALGDALGAIKSLSGLASGPGSGVRITQAELNSIAHARGLGGDFQAAMQRFGDGRNLTPEQEHDLKGILGDVQRVATAKEQVLNKGLDDLANATDAATIRKIDSQLRHVLMVGH